MQLKDRIAVVTGASSGLGLAMVRQLIEQGAHVFGLARSIDTLNALREGLGPLFHPVGCDVTDEGAVKAAFQAVRQAGGGRIDVLINNAGLGKFGKVEELPRAHWDAQIQTNLNGVFFCTREAVPVMKRQNAASGFGGHIVNVASVAGLMGNAQLSAYNTTKFGIRGFSESLMKELRGDGIKVTCIYPGSIETSFFRVAEVNMTPNPMEAEDVASTVLHVLNGPDNYLISEVVMRPLRPKG